MIWKLQNKQFHALTQYIRVALAATKQTQKKITGDYDINYTCCPHKLGRVGLIMKSKISTDLITMFHLTTTVPSLLAIVKFRNYGQNRWTKLPSLHGIQRTGL